MHFPWEQWCPGTAFGVMKIQPQIKSPVVAGPGFGLTPTAYSQVATFPLVVEPAGACFHFNLPLAAAGPLHASQMQRLVQL